MAKLYIRRASIFGLMILVFYLGMYVYSKIGNVAFWLPVPLILVWIFLYDEVVFKYRKDTSKC